MGFLPFMLCHTISVSLFLLPTMWCLNVSFTISRNPAHGLFGWANFEWDRLGLEVYLVAICDFVGGMGYIRVMAYFDPVFVSIVMLMEPILATILGIPVWVASMPGLTTCIGNLIVITGTGIVIVTNCSKSTTKEAATSQDCKDYTLWHCSCSLEVS
ncbi:Drug/Metabolite Transporter (DMT) Superfamily [Thraustotheca clavata]|uniref:Drug/Metabolite Transporter (DMT) Superfamily n=1 Tax=Thraustotheca clavata TaxID=74557 RepID=A0A1V9ZB26_9STRA|nr:Drug/Metabolite Transporter (DMT) Superfamily [Thraustotheca clavata]